MQTEAKKIIIKLPQFQLRSFLTIRFAVILVLLLFACASAYWYRNVRPYLTLPAAHLNAYSSLLSSDLTGRIVEMGPQEGDRIKKGDLLFSFDREPLISKYNQKKSTLELLKSQAEFEKEEIMKAMEGYLAATSEFELGIASAESVQKHLSLMDEAQNKSEEAQSKAVPIQKELHLLELELKNGAFFAPFDGIILRRYKNEGTFCSAGDPVYSLCDPEQMWVEAEVPETMISKIKMGTPARIRINAYPNKEWMGWVSYIGPATVAKSDHLPLSQQVETLPIKISFERKDFLLKPGLSAKVDLKVH